jgi:hypothetical protein
MKLAIAFLAIIGCVIASSPTPQAIRDILDSTTLNVDDKTDAMEKIFRTNDASNDDDTSDGTKLSSGGTTSSSINSDWPSWSEIWSIVKRITNITSVDFECFIKLALTKPHMILLDFFTKDPSSMCVEPMISREELEKRIRENGRVLMWQIEGCDTYNFAKYWIYKTGRNVIVKFLRLKPIYLVAYFGIDNYEQLSGEMEKMWDECLDEMKSHS